MKPLRLLLPLVFFCCLFNSSRAQYVTIPDSAFVVYLQDSFPGCMFGNQMDTMCPGITTTQFIDVNDRGIKDLTGLQYFDNLYQFWANNNQIDYVPSFPQWCVSISLANNQLTSLPTLPANVYEVFVNNNRLDTLPALPAGMATLWCQDNPLTSLPQLPQSLTKLICSNTWLTSLPPLPASLMDLDCAHARLTTLPALPVSIRNLYCNHNQLTSIPTIPVSNLTLFCDHNQLYSLPELPDSMNFLTCDYNPNLHCLPRINFIYNLLFDSVNITCIPNYGNVIRSIPALNNVPLCTPFNANGCPVYWNINGNVYHDTSGNCLQDNNESDVPTVKVNLLKNGVLLQQTYTSRFGSYSFEADSGKYEITVDSSVSLEILCPSGQFDSVSLTSSNTFSENNNFAMQCKTSFDVALHRIFTLRPTRPASLNTIQVVAGDMVRLFGSTCNTVNLSGQLVLTYSGPARYISPAPNALAPVVSGNTLTYTVNDWSTVTANAFDFIIQVDTTAQAGQLICFNATVTPTAGDNNVSNNQLTYCVTVVNSFDPNDKAVYPVSNVDITGDKWLTYTVRFQNTGNAPAEHIYITDTIDTDVDVETFQLLAYSFQPQVIIKGNAVRFNFANINLPDSVNDEPNSHGYVQYKVKIKDNATVGTVINNTAFIYFDFNAPVVTNTTTNTLALPNGITAITNSTATMQLYPNPANDLVMINLSDNLTGGTLTLSDVTGRSLNALPVAGVHSQISTANLSSGVYLVTAVKEGQRVVQRLVVSK